MTKTAVPSSLHAVDVRHLYYFAVVAEESNLRRAAERLFMAQPPLSRQIKQLEERLGVALFERHSKGLVLTDDGARVLAIIQPLLHMKEATFARLQKEIQPGEKALRVGFTTAFEQGVFAGLEAALRGRYGRRAHFIRASSPKLAADVRKGKLDAALVALPLDAPGLAIVESAYAEPLVAAMPKAWKLRQKGRLPLARINGRPLFWFKREANPAFFDFAKVRFSLAGFEPHFLEEPSEHDVLLARVASGEVMALFAASFAAIRRDGVVYSPIEEKADLHLRLGAVTLQGRQSLGADLLDRFCAMRPAPLLPRSWQTAASPV